MKIKILIAFLALATTLPLVKTTLSAYGQIAKVPASSPSIPEVRETDIWHWADEAWSGDNKPYRQARTGIDVAIASKQDMLALEQHYQSLYLKGGTDPLKLFRWAYTAYQVAHRYSSLKEMRQHLASVRTALDVVPFPKTYDFARIKFLIDETFYSEEHYEGLGERLVRQYPNDYMSKYELAGLLVEAYASPKYEQSLAYVHDLILQAPHKPQAYALLGEIYLLRGEKTKNKSDAAKAITAYTQYIHLAPAQDDFSQVAKRIIHRLQQ